MSHSIKALANPNLLRWARVSAGFDITSAARRLGQPETRLEEWEKGDSSPTIAQLRKAAEVYKRPIAVFFLPSVPKDFSPLHDFRRLPRGYAKDYSPELLYLIRRTRQRQEWVVDLRRYLGTKANELVGTIAMGKPLELLARQVREQIGVSLEQQKACQGPDQCLRLWIGALERLGILVFQSSTVDIEEMRGFALADPIAPIIVLNSKDSRRGRVFTLIHELAHVLLGEEGVSNLSVALRPANHDQRVEVFCNALAAEVLVPSTDFRTSLPSATQEAEIDSVISRLSQIYKVSQEVIARKLTDLRIMTTEDYEARRTRYHKAYEEFKQKQAEEYRVPYARIVVRDNGHAFTRMVLNAYGEDLITASDVSDLLNAKLEHFEKIESEVLELTTPRGTQ